MIQAIHKGVEIELELHQFQHGWKCDYTLIKHPERTKTFHLGDEEFATMELARESAMQKARDAIDQAQPTDGARPTGIASLSMSPPRKKQRWAQNIVGLVISGLWWYFSAPGSAVHSMFLVVLILDVGWLGLIAVEALTTKKESQSE